MRNSFSRDQIEHFLKFPKEDLPELHQASKEDDLIIFLGAGVAKLYGCFLWVEMAKELAKKLRENKIISYSEENILYMEAENDPRKVISICYSLCSKDAVKMSIYKKTIKETINLKNEETNNLKEIYGKIFSLNPKVYLTTNIDLGIQYYSSLCTNTNQRIYNCTLPSDKEVIEQIDYKIFKDSNIIYLHGNEEYLENSILTVESYLEYYSNRKFLEGIYFNIDNGFIIFIGYGLKEWDIIERIYKIYKSNRKSSKKEFTGLILTPIFSYEIVKFTLEQEYYKSFGVRSIPYLIDDNGHKELLRVLTNLKNALDISRKQSYDVFKEIEET